MKNTCNLPCAQLGPPGNDARPSRRRWLIAAGAGTLTGKFAGTLTRTLAVTLGSGTTAYAQGSALPKRIGIIAPANAAEFATRLAALKQGLRENGLIEGRHFVIDLVYAERHNERLPALVSAMLLRGPALIMTPGSPTVKAVQAATRRVPVVMTGSNDPVGSGFVASLSRPGSNITGLSNQSRATTRRPSRSNLCAKRCLRPSASRC